MKRLSLLCAGLLLSSLSYAASVSFIEPADGATVGTTFPVKFAVEGMDVKPAGELSPTSGHHHLLINAAAIPSGEVVPFDETHIHFGKGQTEATVTLKPGTYKLTMQFANGAHQSYGEPLSKSITVNVK
ncbi:DUF4399 domain-containing protein [Actimicrobium antarcticum]|uniref:DUF4399 domain-containing protein n=1 Tax=Actimicrobium antarcticum TaxID=1051899 RepID=A0ABP7SZT1_9BURK